MNNEEKKSIILDRVNQCQIHIDLIKEDIKNNPNGDVPEKPDRYLVLEDRILQKEALELELFLLTQIAP